MKNLRTALLLIVVAALVLSGPAAMAGRQPEPVPGSTKTTPPVTKVTVGKVKSADAAVSAVDKTKLLNPSALTEKAPETFGVRFKTSKGDFVVEVTRAWSPNGADRFYNLVRNGFYDDCRFFRVLPNFMAQFGINGDPAVSKAWMSARITDDPVVQSNKRGFVSYAMAGPNTRTTQLFINFADRNAGLDGQGFSPFGKVTVGMDVVDKLYNGYGEGAPQGQRPGPGAGPGGGKRLPEQVLREARLHQDGATHEVGDCSRLPSRGGPRAHDPGQDHQGCRRGHGQARLAHLAAQTAGDPL